MRPNVSTRSVVHWAAFRADGSRTWMPYVVVAASTFFVIRVLGDGWSGGFPISFPDSSSYFLVAKRGPFTGRFWFDERPIGLPLLAWCVGRNVRLLNLAQTTIYIGAFVFLGVAVCRMLTSRPAKVMAVVFVSAVATQPRFAQWNTHVLSESLAMSFAVAALGGWLWWAGQPTGRRLLLAGVLTSAWLAVRDSHVVPIVAAVIPALLVACVLRRRRAPVTARRLALVAAGLVVVVGYSLVSQTVSQRDRYGIYNNVGMRILVDADMTEWFVDHGMPLDDAVRGRTGRNSWDDGSAFIVDPSLEGFRNWAETDGTFVEARSFVERWPFWMGKLHHELDSLLGYQFDEYDGFNVHDRLPVTWLGLSGPRSRSAFWWWSAAAVAGVVAAIADRRTRRVGLVVGVGLFAILVEGYVSYAGDSMEVARHLVGPISRFTLIAMVGATLLTDQAVSWTRRVAWRRFVFPTRRDPAPSTGELETPAPASAAASTDGATAPQRDLARGWRSAMPLSAGALTVVITAMVLAAVFGNEYRSRNYDPMYMRTLVDRTTRFGGTYYENGIHNKGPVEPLVYSVASALGGWDGSWLVLSVIITIAGFGLAVVIGRTAIVAGASTAVAGAVAIGVAYHFLLSPADYSGSLYARQITVTLFVAGWGLILVQRCWTTERRGTLSAVAIGVLAGLAAQTLLSEVPTAALLIGTAAFARRGATRGPSAIRVAVLASAAAVAAVLAAPLWYLLRGSFDEFWSGWWTYASFSSTATARSFPAQLGLAWDQAWAYYRRFPLSFIVIASFAASTVLFWRGESRRQRVLRAGTAAWILAAWLEMAMSQRYSSHYFTVVAVPTWIAFAFVATDAEKMIAARSRRAWRSAAVPVVAFVTFLYLGGTDPFLSGLARASQFTSTEQLGERTLTSLAAPIRAERAVLDLVTRQGDPLLAWTSEPWIYPERGRVSATRFIWKTFLMGEIYLAGSGPQYVLPHSWEWFADDLDQSQPLVYFEENDSPRTDGNPFDDYVDANFRTMYTESVGTMALRNDLADEVVSGGRGGEPWSPDATAAPGWTTRPGQAQFAASGATDPVDGPVLGRGSCWRADFDVAGDRSTAFAIRVLDGSSTAPYGEFRFADGRITSSADGTQFDDQPWDPVDASRVAVLVGDRSVVVVADGTIVGAIPVHRRGADTTANVSVVLSGISELHVTNTVVAEIADLGTARC